MMDNPVQNKTQNTQDDYQKESPKEQPVRFEWRSNLLPVITTLQIKGHHVPQCAATAPYNQGRRRRQASLVGCCLPPPSDDDGMVWQASKRTAA